MSSVKAAVCGPTPTHSPKSVLGQPGIISLLISTGHHWCSPPERQVRERERESEREREKERESERERERERERDASSHQVSSNSAMNWVLFLSLSPSLPL